MILGAKNFFIIKNFLTLKKLINKKFFYDIFRERFMFPLFNTGFHELFNLFFQSMCRIAINSHSSHLFIFSVAYPLSASLSQSLMIMMMYSRLCCWRYEILTFRHFSAEFSIWNQSSIINHKWLFFGLFFFDKSENSLLIDQENWISDVSCCCINTQWRCLNFSNWIFLYMGVLEKLQSKVFYSLRRNFLVKILNSCEKPLISKEGQWQFCIKDLKYSLINFSSPFRSKMAIFSGRWFKKNSLI